MPDTQAHSHSGNVEQSDVTAEGTVYWKFKYFLESPWGLKNGIDFFNPIINCFDYYSLTLQVIFISMQDMFFFSRIFMFSYVFKNTWKFMHLSLLLLH